MGEQEWGVLRRGEDGPHPLHQEQSSVCGRVDNRQGARGLGIAAVAAKRTVPRSSNTSPLNTKLLQPCFAKNHDDSAFLSNVQASMRCFFLRGCSGAVTSSRWLYRLLRISLTVACRTGLLNDLSNHSQRACCDKRGLAACCLRSATFSTVVKAVRLAGGTSQCNDH
jgi:hypothetical protein